MTVSRDRALTETVRLDPAPSGVVFAGAPPVPLELSDGRLVFEARARSGGAPLGAVTLRYRSGGSGGFRALAMERVVVDDEIYRAYVPDQLPGTLVNYFIEASDAAGGVVFSPEGAPVTLASHRVGEVDWTPALASDFEADDGGFTVGSADDHGEQGIWERAIPVASDLIPPSGSARLAQPEEDFTSEGPGFCFLTGLGNPGALPEEHSLDGRTTLRSPVVDLHGAGAARLRLALWYVNGRHFSDGSGSRWQDPFLIEGSTDDGATWRVLESLRVVEPGWQEVTEDGISPSLIEAAIDDVRIETTTGVGTSSVAGGTRLVHLRQNTPNPFNPSTVISYQLKEERPVRLAIYDGSGRLVRRLVDRVEGVGDHSVTWDGRTELGLHAPSGVYFYRLEALDFSQSRKMSLAR
jgi:hypothetical protein